MKNVRKTTLLVLAAMGVVVGISSVQAQQAQAEESRSAVSFVNEIERDLAPLESEFLRLKNRGDRFEDKSGQEIDIRKFIRGETNKIYYAPRGAAQWRYSIDFEPLNRKLRVVMVERPKDEALGVRWYTITDSMTYQERIDKFRQAYKSANAMAAGVYDLEFDQLPKLVEQKKSDCFLCFQ